MLCGGVGGARMARALSSTVAPDRLTVVVNVGDDDYMYGVHVAADLDTVVHTLAGIEGPNGWGIAADTFAVMDELDRRGITTSFRLGDRDLAGCLRRTTLLRSGRPLSAATREQTEALGIAARVIPASDDPIRTRIHIDDGTWLSFQEYFVERGHRDQVIGIEYEGAAAARAAPGVLAAIAAADVVVIAPSNPPLSIWPILGVPGVKEAVAAAPTVVAVSPLFAGKPLKGPADRVLTSLGLPKGTGGILAAYEGLLSMLIVDEVDRADTKLTTDLITVVAADTRIGDPQAGRNFAAWLLDTITR